MVEAVPARQLREAEGGVEEGKYSGISGTKEVKISNTRESEEGDVGSDEGKAEGRNDEVGKI